MAKLIIAGEQRDASDGGTTEIRNPATGELVDRVAAGTYEDVNNAIDAADSAFRKWSAVSPAQRAEILYKAVHLLKDRDKDLARLLTQEQGKPLREAVLEIRRFAHTLEHYAGLAKTIRGGYVPALDDRRYGMIVKKADRRVWIHRSLEFSGFASGQQNRAGVSDGEHGGREAGRNYTAHRHPSRTNPQ
jgi:acyl-CoA reductase-like NAD-dependent aldehyde dehydrogenase